MPRKKLRSRVIAIAVVSACGFSATNIEREDGATSAIDSSQDAFIPPPVACVAASTECIGSGSKVRVCDGSGSTSHDVDCSWGCLDEPQAHCGQLAPAGGAVTSADLDSTTLADVTITAAPTVVIDTDTGSITGKRAAGAGIISGIDYTVRGNVAVFRFGKLEIDGQTVEIRGHNAAALVSMTDIKINAVIDAQGDCNGREAGPGGGSGASKEEDGNGSGGGGSGSGSDGQCTGGGGAADGGSGGDGGNANNGATAFGTPEIANLVGGGGGGGGGGDNGGDGGGGGGALQLVANQRIEITGGINAGGCGGRTGVGCGGGGGAGGIVLIEAPVIKFNTSVLAVNGGGGGGGSNGTSGERANFSQTKASGGNGGGGPGAGNSGGDGGDGGDDNTANGSAGENNNHAGGGGGGVGRMRFNTLSGSIVTNGLVTFSPQLSTGTTQTTVSRGMAMVR